MSKKRPFPDSILCIDLTEDDSDDDLNQRLCDVRRSLNPGDDNSIGRGNGNGNGSTLLAKRAKVKEERKRKAVEATAQLALQTDGIEVVEAAAPPIVPVVARMPTPSNTSRTSTTSTKGDADDEDDIEIIGAKNELRLPHLRQDCTQFKFDAASAGLCPDRSYPRSTLDNNAKSCDLCYCYVCDCPVKECQTWSSEASTTCGANHCCATNRVPFWEKERTHVKKTAKPQLPMEPRVPRQPTASTSVRGGIAAAAPDSVAAAALQTTECRRCKHPQRPKSFASCGILGASDIPSDLDLCERCGRVARDEDFEKLQTRDFEMTEGLVRLGMREIKFRIRARDPRKLPEYSFHWLSNANSRHPEWQYSEADMDEDVFRHKIGTRPFSSQIIKMMTYVPADATFSNGHDSDALLFESEHDVDLFRLMDDVCSSQDIQASWSKDDRQGTLRIDAYVSSEMFKDGAYSDWMLFLGLWYRVFPLQISIIPTISTPDLSWMTRKHSFLESIGLGADAVNFVKSDLTRISKEFKKNGEDKGGKLTLVCSNGAASEGHFCKGDASFSGLFSRFYTEQYSFQSKEAGLSNYTRALLRSLVNFYEGKTQSKGRISIIFGMQAHAFSQLCAPPLERLGCTIQAVMTRLENIGHEAEDFVEGLNVELLGFQRQTLKWALERETMEGGIQTLLWGKLPEDPSREYKNLYFNPLLSRFRREPPNLVRGGFIAEEMGLGKTVISLALILKNPAPATPASGSPIFDLDKATSPSRWDKKLYKSTSTSNKKRGSILCRGTLVICPVSLVGQWIEEAKSKLEDPGLVYPYHGQTRKRDAKILSKNSIVVTTYQVIASDATHHAKKAGKDYCPPLEQVRWWRIICDEGHSLRERSTMRSSAVLSLVADHKWLVSGTPLNTSFKDLVNQFKFLGIEDADEMIRAVGGTGGRRPTDPVAWKIQFLLGNIMMRHSQKQKYRGTETTLMSLPKKTERAIKISFAGAEKREYEKIEKTAHDFYVDFRKKNRVNHHYLKLTQKLMPLRVACAGGKYPLPESVGEMCEDNHKKMKPVEFSNFAFTAKLQVLIKELERIRDSDPSSKSLVFSQFGSTLEWLQQELPKHGFQYRTLKGDMTMPQRAKALHDFQSDPPTTIFLLSMRAGAVGINLTQANRVFLMEPCFNPALESQAIGRVHRLGQKREVEIIRLIHEDTVESRMLKLLEKKYGNSVESKDAEGIGGGGVDDDDDDQDKKMPAVPTAVGLVGNVSKDKVQIMTDEFDLLFGAEGFVGGAGDEEGSDAPPVADMVESFAGGYI